MKLHRTMTLMWSLRFPLANLVRYQKGSVQLTNQTFPFKDRRQEIYASKASRHYRNGEAFYDAIHGGGDTSSNRRPVPKNAAPTTKNVAIWEIHPS